MNENPERKGVFGGVGTRVRVVLYPDNDSISPLKKPPPAPKPTPVLAKSMSTASLALPSGGRKTFIAL